MNAEEVVARLEGVRPTGEGRWSARCPSHGDRGPSLSVREGDGGRVLLHCFAGCSFTAIVEAMGIEPRHLFPPRDGPWRPTRPRSDPDREARALFDRLVDLRRLPSPERARDELEVIGTLLLGGIARLRDAADIHGDDFKTFELRLVFEAMQALARQGTPRRWFSPLALSRVIDAAYQESGNARRLDIHGWCRFAIANAVRASREARP